MAFGVPDQNPRMNRQPTPNRNRPMAATGGFGQRKPQPREQVGQVPLSQPPFRPPLSQPPINMIPRQPPIPMPVSSPQVNSNDPFRMGLDPYQAGVMQRVDPATGLPLLAATGGLNMAPMGPRIPVPDAPLSQMPLSSPDEILAARMRRF